jgi:hypothetical protein
MSNERRNTITAMQYSPKLQNIQQARRISHVNDRQVAAEAAMKAKEKMRFKNRRQLKRNSVAQGAGIAAARDARARRQSRVLDDSLDALYSKEGQAALKANKMAVGTTSSIAEDPRLIAARLRRENIAKEREEKIRVSTTRGCSTTRGPVQREWLRLIYLSRHSVRLIQPFMVHRMHHAKMVKGASAIQQHWRRWYPNVLEDRERAFMTKLLPVIWRVKMGVRCKQRQFAARRVRLFCKEFMNARALFTAIGHNFRKKVLRIQTRAREFLLMTRMRIRVMERIWNEIGHRTIDAKEAKDEAAKEEARQSTLHKRRKKKEEDSYGKVDAEETPVVNRRGSRAHFLESNETAEAMAAAATKGAKELEEGDEAPLGEESERGEAIEQAEDSEEGEEAEERPPREGEEEQRRRKQSIKAALPRTNSARRQSRRGSMTLAANKAKLDAELASKYEVSKIQQTLDRKYRGFDKEIARSVQLSQDQQEVLGQTQRAKDIVKATRRRRVRILACEGRDTILRKYIHEYRANHVATFGAAHDREKSFFHNLQTGLKEVLGIDAEKPSWPMVLMYTQIRQNKQFVAEVEREVALCYDTFMFDLFAQQVAKATACRVNGVGEGEEEKAGEEEGR